MTDGVTTQSPGSDKFRTQTALLAFPQEGRCGAGSNGTVPLLDCMWRGDHRCCAGVHTGVRALWDGLKLARCDPCLAAVTRTPPLLPDALSGGRPAHGAATPGPWMAGGVGLCP